MTGRLFIGSWPDAATRQQLAEWQRALASPPARRVPVQDLHLTLHFIGVLADARLADVLAAADVAPAPIELTLDGLERWRGGLAVAVASRVPDALAALHRTLGAALRQCGLPEETREYRPHVTLARHAAASLSAASAAFAAPPPLAWRSFGHVLAMRDGAHYRILQRWPRVGIDTNSENR